MFGLIARADNGGLSAQTWEIWRHCHPDRTLVIDLGHGGRGVCDVSRYNGDATIVYGYPSDRQLRQFLDGLDVMFTCEAAYNSNLFRLCREHNVRSVLQANPELYGPDCRAADVVTLPTNWEQDRIPHGTVLPVPVARDLLPYRQRTSARTFVHIVAPAMLDRNGTQLVIGALPWVQQPCKLIMVDARHDHDKMIRAGVVEIEWRHEVDNYWHVIPDEADVLLLPRRYGGLSLPMQEAASLGLPIVSLDLAPQNDWLPAATLVPTSDKTPARMKGGTFDVWTADPAELAAVMDTLISTPALVANCSRLVGDHAESISWEWLTRRYCELLGCDAAVAA